MCIYFVFAYVTENIRFILLSPICQYRDLQFAFLEDMLPRNFIPSLFDFFLIFFPASIAPSKRRDIADSAFRAMIAGTVACFMTACIAGTVYKFVISLTDHEVSVCQYTNFITRSFMLSTYL